MIYIDRTSKIPQYSQLYTQLKRAIEAGEYSESPLTSIRGLSQELGISKNTVNQAYQQPLAEGYIYSVPGSGYFVNKMSMYAIEQEQECETMPILEMPNLAPVPYDFCYGSLEGDAFPWGNWKLCIKNALLKAAYDQKIKYPDKEGELSLRKTLQAFLKTSRGVNCFAEQILICGSIVEALWIISKLLSPDSYPVGFEDPGYDGARDVFIRNKYTVNLIPVTEHGISLDELQKSSSRLVYITPSHQYPTGHVLPISSRFRLLSMINERDGFIIEDDYDSEFRYGSAMPIPSLQSLDQDDRVIYLGTFSKTLSPELRVAYMVLPKRLLNRYHEVFAMQKTHTPKFVQEALAQFIDFGYYSKHLRKIVQRNEKKYLTIVRILREYDLPCIHAVTLKCGIHVLIKIDLPLSESAILGLLESKGVRIYSARRYLVSS